MRVTPEQIRVFDQCVHQYFGEDAVFWLFGSRVDDNKKGGDYDFLVETHIHDAADVERKLALLAQLQETAEFEDEKIDLVIKRANSNFDMPIYTVAKIEGIQI
jgi:uncharacterized protein